MGLRHGAKGVLKKPKRGKSVKDATELVKLSSLIARQPNTAINSEHPLVADGSPRPKAEVHD